MDELSKDNFSAIFQSAQLTTRPISNLSFAINYYIGGDRVQGYHIFNICIHIISSIALYYLIFNTLYILNDPRFKNLHFEISFFTALIWLTHPLNTQSVTYIVQRMNSMASMFFILSILFYILARKQQNSTDFRHKCSKDVVFLFLVSFTSGILAIGSKEIAATLPIAIIAYEWFFFQKLAPSWVKEKALFFIAMIASFAVIAFIYTKGNLADAVFTGYNFRDFTLYERLFTQLRVIVHYFELLLAPLPDNLSLDYSFPLSTSLFKPITTLFCAIFLTGLLLTGFIIATRERLLSFCIFWFFLNLIIESSVIPLEIIYEHRTYLPSMFFILFFVILAFRLLNYPKVTVAILLSLSIIFSYWTIQRNDTWNNPILFWQKSLEKFPDNARIHTNLGVEYFKKGQYPLAEKHFLTALKLKPRNALVYNNLAEIQEQNGNYEQAEIFLRNAIEITPNHVLARMNLASLLKKLGRFEESLEHYFFVHQLYPEYSVPNMEIGQLLLYGSQPKKALSYLLKSLPRQPDNFSLLMAIAESNMRIGKMEESIEYYKKALKKTPGSIIALFNLAMLYSETGNPEQASLYYQKAYLVQPQFVPVTFNYGNFLLRTGNFTKAEEVYQKFLSQENLIADAHNNLALTYLSMNLPQKALSHFEITLKIAPHHTTASENIRLLRESLGNTSSNLQHEND